jgi:hypothetical protein
LVEAGVGGSDGEGFPIGKNKTPAVRFANPESLTLEKRPQGQDWVVVIEAADK